jgi:hypothetical protein
MDSVTRDGWPNDCSSQDECASNFSRGCSEFRPTARGSSANRFGRISPTTAADVLEELVGRIPLIVDGGSTTHGIESTVIAPREGVIEIPAAGPDYSSKN